MAYKTWFQDETNIKGAFVRQQNRFVTPFGTGDGELPLEAGRYRLIWSAACPWATRQMIVRSLLGLEEVLSVGLVDPVRPKKEFSDWAFTLDPGGVDPVLKARYLSDLYLKTDPGYQGRFTVPAIVDIRSGTVVNNDYFNLSYYWETVWRDFHKADAPDLFPEDLRENIIALNDIIFHEVNNGVYKAGFARSQEAYEAAYALVFKRLDWLDGRLSAGRYLFGDRLTDSDIRLWVTLVRFDAAYYNAFRVNRNRLTDFPHLWAYARDLYQIPAFGENTYFDHIKAHYHLCCDPGNIYGIVPKGPDISRWNAPPNRSLGTFLVSGAT
ncbi:MAG: glutathione S-transferase C-terminal domain-containing protein [Spirochaetaceae bacterium]|nr:glutathione S-transferase C-terminal domain-containing protein [Spirochaetaceae bacterium]